jgi:predicted nucleotidyltransferase
MYFLDVISLLNKLGVRYLVVGGVALVLHGVVRLTADIDLLIDLKKENIGKFLNAMKTLGYKPKLPVDPAGLLDPKIRKEWLVKKNMVAFSFMHPKEDYKLVDLLINEPVPFPGVYKRMQIVHAGKVPIKVVSLSDLIKLKKKSAKEQDLKDIEMLRELSKNAEKQKK